MKFDIDYAPSKAFHGQYFYEGLRPLIKLWIDKEIWELHVWNYFVIKNQSH